jgi:hypothetical protein
MTRRRAIDRMSFVESPTGLLMSPDISAMPWSSAATKSSVFTV